MPTCDLDYPITTQFTPSTAKKNTGAEFEVQGMK